MNSLFSVLNNQHGDEFAPLRCNPQTVSRLIRYFEDLAVEHELSALVIEGRCLDGQSSRESERLGRLAARTRRLYLISCDPQCRQRTWDPVPALNVSFLQESGYHNLEPGPFVLVTDPRFCGLLASCAVSDKESCCATPAKASYEMVWTFDTNVVFTAIEYLLARIGIQQPDERPRLEELINTCTPLNSSIRMALSFTTKLARLMQRQSEMETAINTISSAISSTLELDVILQSAVEEVGRALKARRAALILWEEGTSKPETVNVYEREDSAECGPQDGAGPASSTDQPRHIDEPTAGAGKQGDLNQIAGPIEVPVTYRNSVIGVLAVEDNSPGRNWEDEEILMVKTVSDQLAVAISHARLFKHVQVQAMTDPLTGLYNVRYFRDCLQREMKLADRNRNELTLLLLDLDHLKRINDSLGHRAGDACLCHVARMMKGSVRETDVCARYGGEEFVIILPNCSRENAISLAENLREAIAGHPIQKIGQVTASIGVATYPGLASSPEELIERADRAMYLAKASGRNRVRTLPQRAQIDLEEDRKLPGEATVRETVVARQ
jgi:diguanylate cyclase (GGDEF)-like protein